MTHAIYLSVAELTWLESQLGEDPYRLKKEIRQGIKRLADKAEQLKEITARKNADAFWEEAEREKHLERILRMRKRKEKT